MSDERVRALLRRWRESGSIGDERAFLRERVRVGSFPAGRYELLERMGHFDGPVDPRLAEWSASLADAIVWTTEADALPKVPRWPMRLPRMPVLDDCWEPGGSPEGHRIDVARLVVERREALHAAGWVEAPRARTLAGGRLFVYWPECDLCDGAAEASSGGFLNLHNCAPPSTWVSLTSRPIPPTHASFGRFLLAWIPPRLLEVVSDGIQVNPEECIAWASRHDDPFDGLLHAAGYLGP